MWKQDNLHNTKKSCNTTTFLGICDVVWTVGLKCDNNFSIYLIKFFLIKVCFVSGGIVIFLTFLYKHKIEINFFEFRSFTQRKKVMFTNHLHRNKYRYLLGLTCSSVGFLFFYFAHLQQTPNSNYQSYQIHFLYNQSMKKSL